jgi:hypothetical protein
MRTLLLLLLAPLLSAIAANAAERPRKIYAHYIGSLPAGTGAIAHHMRHAHVELGDPDQGSVGGFYRDYALAPYDLNLTLEQSADLEIRRAMRIGIDGFAVDAWAGGDHARAMVEAMFRVAERRQYPFEITLCLDPNTIGGPIETAAPEAIRWLLDRFGQSPNLARRDGKPLIFGYQSLWSWVAMLERETGSREVTLDLRAQEANWLRIAEAYQEIEDKVGAPLYFHFCLSGFTHQLDHRMGDRSRSDLKAGAAKAAAAGGLPAVGVFIGRGLDVEQIAKAVKAGGAEWSQPIMLQYENLRSGVTMAGRGMDWIREDWAAAIRHGSTLIQLTTWNDYNENSNLAPGLNSRYAYYDLTGYFIAWWKAGEAPAIERDKAYLFSRKYPADATVAPFKARTSVEGAIEATLLLTEPATARLIGRGEPWEAPTGLSWQQFPVTAGPVILELERNGEVFLRLESPEPVTDRPFREDNGVVGISSEFERHWREDFGRARPHLYSEYGDADGDGLPNWFEKLYFGTFGDMATATRGRAEADADRDGRSNLEEYLARTHPRRVDLPQYPLVRAGD